MNDGRLGHEAPCNPDAAEARVRDQPSHPAWSDSPAIEPAHMPLSGLLGVTASVRLSCSSLQIMLLIEREYVN